MSLRDDRSWSILSRRASAALIALTVGVLPIAARAQQSTRPSSHTVKRGDTLWDISKSYLGDPFLWPEIYRINTDQIEDPHWIYPGELLKLPVAQEKVVAQAPPSAPARVQPPVRREPPTSVPATFAVPKDTSNLRIPAATSSVRMGEYIASPWVDERGGPRGAGWVMAARDLPGAVAAAHSRMNLYESVLVTPPDGSASAERQLYLTYRLGPLFEDFGQIVIPTGVIQITRPVVNGEAAIGRVVKLFSEMLQGDHLVPYDSAAALVAARPVPISNGHSAKVRWVYGGPVLPSLQNYVVVDLSRRDVSTGDQIELFEPRKRSLVEGELATPEVPIARAQIMRVTPFGAAAVIISQEQPKIEEGTSARIAAKIP